MTAASREYLRPLAFPLHPLRVSDRTQPESPWGATMNHSEVISAVATALDLTRKQAETTIAAVLTPVAGALGRGEEVKLNGFGVFEVVDRPARPGRNPQTGATIEIAASRSVKFKAAKPLRDALNPSATETTA